ncbi:hypothetical protein DFH09DRAFT_1154092 [Mycena vulgaris]|nr:hypothetical protein DFH09DRAFT_1154092 [Mycena vulgaris]
MSESSASMAALVQSAFLLQKVKVFDYLLSLELEVSLVWGSKWSLSKILYMCSRYPPFIDVPLVLWCTCSPTDCFPVYTASSWGTFFGIATAEAILVLRTYALMGCNDRVLVLLVIQYVVCSDSYLSVLKLIGLTKYSVGPPPLPIVVGCSLADGSVILVVAFICALFMETVLMVCTIWVGVKRFRHSPNPLIHTVVSGRYYVFLISVGNLAVLIWGPVELVDLFNTFLRVMHSVLSTRIVLHVRAVHREEARIGISSRDTAEPRFRIPGTTMEYTIE